MARDPSLRRMQRVSSPYEWEEEAGGGVVERGVGRETGAVAAPSRLGLAAVRSLQLHRAN